MLFYVDTRKNLKAIRANGYRFVPKGGTFPTENHHACCEKLRFVRSIYPNLSQMGQNLYHDMLMPLHDSMPSFKNFRWVSDLLELKNQASHYFASTQRCHGVWNSFPFLAWGLSMHPRTKIWFFNEFICTRACTCSSNLYYAHKCIENSVNAKNVQTNPENSQKFTQHSCCSILTQEKKT